MANRRKVTMTSVSLTDAGVLLTHEATDFVELDDVERYIADARTRWQSVTVGETLDNGPAGDNGEYIFPLEIL
jgi:hypothetical protein